MANESDETVKILVAMPRELKEEIEDYQFGNRIPNRTAAILELIEKGLGKSGKDKEPAE